METNRDQSVVFEIASKYCISDSFVEYVMQNARLDEAQAGIRIAGRNINNFRYTDDTILWQKARKN